MRRIHCVILLGLAFFTSIGCDKGNKTESKQSDAAQNSKEPPKKSGPSNTIHLTAEAQRLAGMQILEVESKPIPDVLTVPGQISMNEEHTAHVGTYTSGRITVVSANVGDRVRAGQLLARMHSHEVHETLAAYQTAKQDVQREQSGVAYSQRARDRLQRLYATQYASAQEVERAENDLRTAQTALANAKISLERETAHLSDILHLAPERLSSINEETEQVPVVAPFAGTVTARMVTPGSVVEPGQEVFTVSNLDTVWMIASVNEPDIAKVKVGAKAEVATQAYPNQQFQGSVVRLGTELDAKTRTLPIRLLLRNPGERLRIAMYASAALDQGMTHPAIFVPEEALQEVNGGFVVFVRRGAEDFEARPVDIGQRLEGSALIRAGLRGGDAVIVKSSFVAKSELLKDQIGE